MSHSVFSWAKRQQVGSSTAKAVLLAIATYADEEGHCWPSQLQLASDTELSERAIRTALVLLEKKGVLSRQRRCRGDGARAADLIVLCLSHELPAADAGRDASTYRHEMPVDSSLPANGAAPTGTSCPINRQEMPVDLPARGAGLGPPMGDLELPIELPPSPSKPKRSKPAATDEDFAAFRRAYPRRTGSDPRKTARVSYDRAIRNGATPAELLAAAQRFAREKADEDPRFIPMSSTWLNQERWKPDDRGSASQSPASELADAWNGTPRKIWQINVQLFRDMGHWPSTLGPRPGDVGYRGPPELLRELGIVRAA